MDDSVAILGRQPALGLAELESLYGSGKVLPLNNQAARVKIMPCSIDFPRLGGVTKLCKVLSIFPTTNWEQIEQFLVTAAPAQSARMPEGKMHLGLSAYGMPVTTKRLLATGLNIKRAIRQAHSRSVHLVPNKEFALSTAQVTHNKLTTENGWELIFVRDGNRTVIAQTAFTQDIESYNLRDRGRPKRDTRVGMLPPKLAQIIVNLATGTAAPSPSLVVVDPFCGTGVVLQEALLAGYSVYGTDLMERMAEYSTANLQWLSQRIGFQGAYRVEVADATTNIWKGPIDTVASETYLGKPFTSIPDSELLARTVSDCNTILKSFLQNLYRQLAPGTRLCIAVPAWQVKPDHFQHLPLIDRLHDIGYNVVSFEHTRGKRLIYYREGQIVGRELLVLKRA